MDRRKALKLLFGATALAGASGYLMRGMRNVLDNPEKDNDINDGTENEPLAHAKTYQGALEYGVVTQICQS